MPFLDSERADLGWPWKWESEVRKRETFGKIAEPDFAIVVEAGGPCGWRDQLVGRRLGEREASQSQACTRGKVWAFPWAPRRSKHRPFLIAEVAEREAEVRLAA